MNDVFKGDRNDPQYLLGLWNEILLRVLQIDLPDLSGEANHVGVVADELH